MTKDIISTYDLYNRKIKEQYSNNGTILTKQFEYDYLDRLTRETDFNGNATVYEYAYDGQPTKVTNAAGETDAVGGRTGYAGDCP